MWWLLIVVVGAIVAMWLIDRRRGSSGASKADDLRAGADPKTPDSGFNLQGGLGGGGDGGF